MTDSIEQAAIALWRADAEAIGHDTSNPHLSWQAQSEAVQDGYRDSARLLANAGLLISPTLLSAFARMKSAVMDGVVWDGTPESISGVTKDEALNTVSDFITEFDAWRGGAT